MDGLSTKANIEPAGKLFRVTPYEAPPMYLKPVALPEVTVLSASGETWSETMMLLGYDLSPDSVTPGSKVTLTLHWQSTQPLHTNYTSYVHLLTDDGQRVAQSDHRPGGDFYPTSYWQIGEVLRDRHTLSIPDDALAGVYRLRVGMYYQPEPGIISGMGNGVEIDKLTVKDCC